MAESEPDAVAAPAPVAREPEPPSPEHAVALEAGPNPAGEPAPAAQEPVVANGETEAAAEPPPVAPGPGPREIPASQRIAYAERRAKSVVELQPRRHVTAVPFRNGAGREGVVTLIDLSPASNAWFLVRLDWIGGGDPEVYHLENSDPTGLRLRLDADAPGGLWLERLDERMHCELWGAGPRGALAEARAGGRPFAALCGGRLHLRNRTEGRRTPKEVAAEFLRDRVWGGEKITSLVKDTMFRNSFRKKARLSGDRTAETQAGAGVPPRPQLAPDAADRQLEPLGLGLTVAREPGGRIVVGRWYEVEGAPGVLLSALSPMLVAGEVVDRQASRVAPLDAKEESSLVYVVAFDLVQLDLGFALGTEHPRVGWSERAPDSMRDGALPGPDGIGTVAPLVRVGMLNPADAARAVATFTGGFKRSHGAFNAGQLAQVNHASHYGFIEQGTILSKLQPGLSTLVVDNVGTTWMGTWTRDRDADLDRVRFARQNGVPLLEPDPVDGRPRPGALVRQWGAGNWSGSQDKKLRTLRAGICLQQGPHGTFLLYGYFSAATPSAMARVFEAYECPYAMMLDMNALEHTYLAVYRVVESRLVIEHLIDEMKVLDKVVGGQAVPRFVGFPDNRDFFLLTRRERA